MLIFNDLKENMQLIRLREIRHRMTFKNSYLPMQQAMKRYRECKNRKSKSLIRKEMLLCKNYWLCYPLHYYRENLYRDDINLSENKLINYVPEFFFYKLFLPYHNSREYDLLLKDKNITEMILSSLSIPHTISLCKIINGNTYTREMKEVDFEAINNEIISNKYKKLFVKPAKGSGGHGIYVFNREKNGKYISKENLIFDKEFLENTAKKGDYIIDIGIEQDQNVANIYSPSINTFRIITKNENGRISLLCAILRMGRNGYQLDNSDQGGLYTIYDFNSGAIGDHAISLNNEYFEQHPDSGTVFRQFSISKWEDLRNFVTESAKKMMHFTYLGWDIALSQDGPLVIEINSGFALDQLQHIFGGLREILGIDNPEFYWKHRGKR